MHHFLQCICGLQALNVIESDYTVIAYSPWGKRLNTFAFSTCRFMQIINSTHVWKAKAPRAFEFLMICVQNKRTQTNTFAWPFHIILFHCVQVCVYVCVCEWARGYVSLYALQIFVCICVYVHYLAVNLAAPQSGLDDIEQSVSQTLALPHPPTGFLTCRAHVPVKHRNRTAFRRFHTPNCPLGFVSPQVFWVWAHVLVETYGNACLCDREERGWV